VYVAHGFVDEDRLDTGFYRWLYTACTRPTEELYLVNFDMKYFPDTNSG